jgi:hypothetical protein
LRLIWAVSCRSYVLQTDGTAVIEGAGVDNIWVDSLPADLTVTMLMRFGMLEGEESELEIDLLSPAMSGSPGWLATTLQPVPGPYHQAGHEIAFTRPAVFRFDAETPGIYSAEIYTDARHQDAVYFFVREGRPEDF